MLLTPRLCTPGQEQIQADRLGPNLTNVKEGAHERQSHCQHFGSKSPIRATT